MTQSVSDTKSRPSAAKIILAATFFYIASTMLVNPLITSFSAELGTGEALAGVISGLMSVCSLIMRPVGGNLSDRVPYRKLATIGASLMCIAGLGYAAVSTPMQLAVLRIVSGLGYSLCSVCMSTWFASLYASEHVGSAMGTFGMMNALAMAIGPALGVQVAGYFGYRVALACAGIFALASLVLIRSTRASGAHDSVHAEQKEPDDVSSQSAEHLDSKKKFKLLDVRALPAALIITCFTIPYAATQSYIVSYAAAHGAGAYVTFFFPFYAVILLALRYSLKKQFDTVSFGVFLSIASASALIACASLWMLSGPLGLFVAAIFFASSYGLMVSVCQAAAVRACGKEHAGLANGTYYIGFDLGLTLGPVVAGFAIEALGINALYPTVVCAIPIAILIYVIARRRLSA